MLSVSELRHGRARQELAMGARSQQGAALALRASCAGHELVAQVKGQARAVAEDDVRLEVENLAARKGRGGDLQYKRHTLCQLRDTCACRDMPSCKYGRWS